MGIFHLAMKVFKRSLGQSSTSAAGYRAGQKIEDERTGETHDYRRKKDVDVSAVIVPEGSPEWMKDRGKLWNHVEQQENRKDSQLAREIEVSLPRELTKKQKVMLVNDFVKSEITSDGLVADTNLHKIDQNKNPHAHIMMTMRRVDGDGFGQKARDWNDKEKLKQLRERWAVTANKHLKMAGSDVRIDHRSLKDQGIDRAPGVHHSRAVLSMKNHSERLGDKIKQLELVEQQQPENEVNQNQEQPKRQSIDQLIRETTTTTAAPPPRPRDGGGSKSPSLK
jgi:ATP-dependent exoDNAse (exonuclease V) alpha subunit